MNKEELSGLLDNIYELEGLVHLTLTRDDCHDTLVSLIRRKVDDMVRLTHDIPASQSAPAVMEGAEYDNSSEEVLSAERYPEEEAGAPEDESLSDTEGNEMMTAGTLNDRSSTKGRLVFSINDRFRFRRDLFKNSDADFNTTMALVASMDSYDEAESYFIDELGWDSKSATVSDFLNVVKKYFGS